MLDFAVEIGQVESVRDVLFINFAKVLVSFAAQEPPHPGAGIIALAPRCLEVFHAGDGRCNTNALDQLIGNLT
jgi:hypothetical protein